MIFQNFPKEIFKVSKSSFHLALFEAVTISIVAEVNEKMEFEIYGQNRSFLGFVNVNFLICLRNK